MTYQTLQMPNGIRILYLPDESPVSYLGFAINAGTRDEEAGEQGMAHFVEHMLFKGTTHRKSWHIIDRLESIGGQIDAYTTKEDTFIYATVPESYTERAIELLSDILFHSTFPDGEIERERDVVLDEIQSYNDSPSDLIYDEFEEIIFKDSPLGQNILGKEECLNRFTSHDMLRFVERCYTTDEIVFFFSGHMPLSKITKLAGRFFDKPASQRSFERSSLTPYTPHQKRVHKETFQTHCVIGNRSYSLSHKNRIPFVLLNNILGGPFMSSKLNLSIRERNGLAYTVESGITTFSDTGVWTIYFGCDPKNVERCLKLIDKELATLRDTPLEERQLLRAKRQVEGQHIINNQNRENQLLGMAKTYLHMNHCLSDEQILEHIEQITSHDLQQIAQQIFNKEQLTQLLFE